MTLKTLFFASFLFFGGATARATTDPPPPRNAIECVTRGGLPNFFAKLETGGALKVAYLGGSITAQDGWRVKSLAFLNKSYPKTKCSEINAAIGGTGSNLGVLRIDHDVLSQKPDLLFVEFAVNDGGTAPNEIVKAMEGIVRKTWSWYPECDICFVYTFTDGSLNELKSGVLNRSAATMELVADHYGIPTIHMGIEAVRLEKEGKLVMKAANAKMDRVSGNELNQTSKALVGDDGKIPFSKDGVHPYTNTGHQLYEEAIERALPLIKAASINPPAVHSNLPKPMAADNYSKTAMLPMDSACMQGPWTKLPTDNGMGKRYSKWIDSLWQAKPGASLSFKVKGSFVKIYDLRGPDCGKIEITVDGKTTTATQIDGYCTYHRLGIAEIASGLDPKIVHSVSIKVLSESFDKRKILFEVE